MDPRCYIDHGALSLLEAVSEQVNVQNLMQYLFGSCMCLRSGLQQLSLDFKKSPIPWHFKINMKKNINMNFAVKWDKLYQLFFELSNLLVAVYVHRPYR